MPLATPFPFDKWTAENGDALKPPVGAKTLFSSDDYLIMVVGGPNARSDYHCQPTEEFFFQIKGDIVLKVVEDDSFKDIVVREGEMFLLPANIPHSPCRPENTIGLVVERKRAKGALDSMRWYCPSLQAHGHRPRILKEVTFECYDLGIQMKPIIEAWKSDEAGRLCGGDGGCGNIAGATEWPTGFRTPEQLLREQG